MPDVAIGHLLCPYLLNLTVVAELDVVVDHCYVVDYGLFMQLAATSCWLTCAVQ